MDKKVRMLEEVQGRVKTVLLTFSVHEEYIVGKQIPDNFVEAWLERGICEKVVSHEEAVKKEPAKPRSQTKKAKKEVKKKEEK